MRNTESNQHPGQQRNFSQSLKGSPDQASSTFLHLWSLSHPFCIAKPESSFQRVTWITSPPPQLTSVENSSVSQCSWCKDKTPLWLIRLWMTWSLFIPPVSFLCCSHTGLLHIMLPYISGPLHMLFSLFGMLSFSSSTAASSSFSYQVNVTSPGTVLDSLVRSNSVVGF